MTLVLSAAAVFSLATAVFVVYEATRGDSGTRAAAGALPVPATTPATADAPTPYASASEPTPSAVPSSARAHPVAVTSRPLSAGNPTALTRSGGGASHASTSPVGTRTATPTASPTAATGGTSLTPGRTYSIESVDAPGQYWYIQHYLAYLAPANAPQGPGAWHDTAFKLVAGLADPSCFSFLAADGDYLRHQNFRLKQAPDDGSWLFQHDATFCPRAGSVTGSFAFESVNYPGYYLHHRSNELWLDQDDGSSSFRSDSSFWATDPVF
jgi:hypothetical protein